MALSPGTRVGPYEVLSALGAGGMGEVYRAHDTVLHRDVALKVLPESMADDADRLARFRREAQALAALNHQNIAQIYGLDESTRVRALAMELVSGRTLDDIIKTRKLSVEEAVGIARQIAEALEAAHDAGIVHRDLKPANVMVRDDGTVKVLDFGLAKALDPRGHAPTASTFTHQATELGVVMGTPAYMSPEQATGRFVDKRTDIWAFGCVLYEMLTGARVFGADTSQETLAAVLRDPPPFDRLPADVPPHIRRLLARCLDRTASTRLRDIGEARIALIKGAELEATGAVTVRPSRRAWLVLSAGLALFAIAAIAVLATLRFSSSNPIPSRRFELPASIAGSSGWALSPDGSRLAYLSERHLFVHNFTDASVSDLGAVAPASQHPFWSPDGRTIGYGGQGTIRTRPAAGGPDFEVCKLPGAGRLLGAAWMPDNTIMFAAWRDSIYRVAASGGTPALTVAINRDTDVDFHSVVALPDGRFIVARHVRTDDREHLEIFDRGTIVSLTDDRFVDSAEFAPPGHLLLLRHGANAGLWAVPFDRPPIDFSRALRIAPDAMAYVASPDGTIVYVVASPKKSEFVWVTRQGAASLVSGAAVEMPRDPALSRDGRRLLYVMGPDTVVVARDLDTGTDTRLTQPKTDASQRTMQAGCPAWFPSGDQVLYTWGSAEAQKLFSKESSGAAGAREVGIGACGRISVDGREIFDEIDEHGVGRLYRAPLDSNGVAGRPTLVLPADDASNVYSFDLSPGGELLAYDVHEATGRLNVWVVRLANPTERWQITTSGGTSPRFSSDGSELFCFAPASDSAEERAGALMVASVVTKPAVRFGPLQKLFAVGAQSGLSASGGYDVARDGRFLFSRPAPTSAADAPRAVFVQNWKAAIK